MRNLWSAASSRPVGVGFGAALLLFGVYLFSSPYHALQFDSLRYWELARDLEQNGHFSLFNLTTPLRGYLYPLLNYPLIVLERTMLPGYQLALVKAEGTLVAALLFGLVGPQFWQTATGYPVTLGRRLAFIGLGFLFWRDHFSFLLSDFPALLFLLSGAILVLRGRAGGRLLLGGAVLVGTIYIRPVYALALPCLVLWRLWRPVPNSVRRPWVGWAALALGAALVAAPQLLINQHNFQSNSPLVLSRNGASKQDNLYLWHLNMGLGIQKFETSIGSDYPKPQVYYTDATAKVLLAAHPTPQLTTLREYAWLVAAHPLEMMALFGRHLFNGLDVLYPSPYLVRVYAPAKWLALLHYIVFYGALVVAVHRAPRLRRADWLLVTALMLPVLAAVPLVVECRFFISLHLLAYALVCFGLPHPARWRQRVAPAWRLPLLVGFIGFMLVCITLSANTRANLELPVIPAAHP